MHKRPRECAPAWLVLLGDHHVVPHLVLVSLRHSVLCPLELLDRVLVPPDAGLEQNVNGFWCRFLVSRCILLALSSMLCVLSMVALMWVLGWWWLWWCRLGSGPRPLLCSDTTYCARLPEKSPNFILISEYQTSYINHQHKYSTNTNNQWENKRFNEVPQFTYVLGNRREESFSVNWIVRVTNWSETPTRECRSPRGGWIAV